MTTLRRRAAIGTLFTGLFIAAFCFFQGATAPIELTRPIEDIRPGYKVIVDAPAEALATDIARLSQLDTSWNASTGSLEIEGVADPLREMNEATPAQLQKADYRLVLLQAKEVWEDGTYNEINVATLQPWQWLHENEVHVGGEAPLPLETVEMNLPFGMTGKVLDILPCPQLERGAGRTVLTTVDRLARGVIELTLRDANGIEETLRPTDEHLFYSASQGDWLAAGELQPGEHLDGIHGTITVAAVTPLEGTHRVYNMTVQGEHLYRVAECGVLVHNTCAGWNHFFPKFMGNLMGYGETSLKGTHVADKLTKVDHAAFHKNLATYLKDLRTRTGGALDFVTRGGYGQDQIAAKYGLATRHGVMEAFYRKYYGTDHRFYKQFLEEFGRAMKSGKLLP